MTKFELESLGLDAETIRAVQKLHGRDMAKLSAKLPTRDANAATRDAIKAMLPMIQDGEHLKRLLKEANFFYHLETVKPKEAAKGESAE